MTSKINAITTGAGGIEVTGDSSGEIEFQADGSTIATITSSGLSLTGTLPIADGGTGQTTATSAFNALAPSQSTHSGKYLTTDGTNTSWGTISTDPTMGGDLSGTASNAQIVAGSVGTTEIADSAVTDAKISGMSSSKLSGALPAIDGSALTGIAGGKVTKCTQVFLSNSVTSGGTQRTLSGTDLTYTDNSIIKGQFTKDSSSTLLIVQGHTSWRNTSGNCHGTYTWVGTNTTGANTQRYHHALDPYRQNGNMGNHTFTAIFSGLASGTYYALHGSGRGDTGSTTNVVNYNPQSYVGGDTPNENSRSHILVFEVEV